LESARVEFEELAERVHVFSSLWLRQEQWKALSGAGFVKDRSNQSSRVSVARSLFNWIHQVLMSPREGAGYVGGQAAGRVSALIGFESLCDAFAEPARRA
jgi:hypothetical protein